MAVPYPPLEPFDEGTLDAGDGNRIAYEQCGNPKGRPAVVLHGGPGSGSSPGLRQLFDPSLYRVVLFDQRGCGRSTPSAADTTTDLACNTTSQLVADIDALRVHLDIGRWLVLGLSWGSTLAVSYAVRHPLQVSAVVLAGVTTTSTAEVGWLYRGGLGRLFPDEWDRFVAGASAGGGDDVVESYRRLLEHDDASVRAAAAASWNAWDWATASAGPPPPPPANWLDPRFQLARARICAHYFSHGAWLADGVLLAGAGSLGEIPAVLVNGRLDLQAPLVTAWRLAQAWPGAELVVVEGAGHSLGDHGVAAAVVDATDGLAAAGDR